MYVTTFWETGIATWRGRSDPRVSIPFQRSPSESGLRNRGSERNRDDGQTGDQSGPDRKDKQRTEGLAEAERGRPYRGRPEKVFSGRLSHNR